MNPTTSILTFNSQNWYSIPNIAKGFAKPWRKTKDPKQRFEAKKLEKNNNLVIIELNELGFKIQY